VYRRIKEGVLPTTGLDAAALIHDVEYLKHTQYDADKNMIENVGPLLGLPTALAFAIKDIVGYDVPKNITQYDELKKILEEDTDFQKALKDVKFIDNKNHTFYNQFDEKFLAPTSFELKVENSTPIIVNRSSLEERKWDPSDYPYNFTSNLRRRKGDL